MRFSQLISKLIDAIDETSFGTAAAAPPPHGRRRRRTQSWEQGVLPGETPQAVAVCLPADPDDLSGVLGGGEADSQRVDGGGQQRVRSRAEAASLAFARLKEATGVERAFLVGMLALPEAALSELPSRAFAGFVLVVQEPLDITLDTAALGARRAKSSTTRSPKDHPPHPNLPAIAVQEQRSLEAALRATAPPRLLELIRSGLEYSVELQARWARDVHMHGSRWVYYLLATHY